LRLVAYIQLLSRAAYLPNRYFPEKLLDFIFLQFTLIHFAMKQLLQVSSLLIVIGLMAFGCSSSTSPAIEELADGTFTASVENQSEFDGDASFEITIPSSDWFPDAYKDPVLFLTLKTGEIENTERDYTGDIGLSINTLWQDDSIEIEIGSTTFRNTFIHPGTLEIHDVKSGSIKIDEKTQDLLAGNFELISVNSQGSEFNITGKFRAILSE